MVVDDAASIGESPAAVQVEAVPSDKKASEPDGASQVREIRRPRHSASVALDGAFLLGKAFIPQMVAKGHDFPEVTLSAIVEGAIVLAKGEIIGAADLPEALRPPPDLRRQGLPLARPRLLLRQGPPPPRHRRLPSRLRSIDLVTRDAYEPMLPLSVVVHIDYQKAPSVIQRFRSSCGRTRCRPKSSMTRVPPFDFT